MALPFPPQHLPKSEFVESAKRAVRLGFDVIELHAAHGYLLNQFTSPLSNHRTDEYGGNDLSKRLAYPLEVFDAVKEVVPKNIAFGARISGTDWVEGGLNPEEMIVFAKELAQRGCHFVDVTSGQLDSRQQIQFAPGLPKTRSGKIMRRILRKIAHNEHGQLGDTTTLADPSVVDSLVNNRKNI